MSLILPFCNIDKNIGLAFLLLIQRRYIDYNELGLQHAFYIRRIRICLGVESLLSLPPHRMAVGHILIIAARR